MGFLFFYNIYLVEEENYNNSCYILPYWSLFGEIGTYMNGDNVHHRVNQYNKNVKEDFYTHILGKFHIIVLVHYVLIMNF